MYELRFNNEKKGIKMSKQTLAVKYRPKSWDDVVEQESIKFILQQQLDTDTIKNAYLFVGGAGTGKTTCARIFANEINKGMGNPIELDAASNSSVDDVRNIIQQAKTASLNSEYKVFIIDECHSLSNTAWQAFLKLIEEPPAKSIFIFCTTNPEKIPKTILSRVQRYDFRRISQQGIKDRLKYILGKEKNGTDYEWETDAITYIAKLADGGMRDAITLMDKCLSYSKDLTVENVTKALGVANYEYMMGLVNSVGNNDPGRIISIIEDVYSQGNDLKQFVKQFTNFVLDIKKWYILGDFKYLSLPNTATIHEWLNGLEIPEEVISSLLQTLVYLNGEIKYDGSPKNYIESKLILLVQEGSK